MPIIANDSPEEKGLNQYEWARARKNLGITGITDHDTWCRMNRWQRDAYHQIELMIKSITMDDLSELDESRPD